MDYDQDNSGDPLALLTQSVQVLKKYGHAVFLSSLLLSIAGIAGTSLIPNVYRATTTILVDPQKIPERYVASTVTSDPDAHLSTLTQQVLSASRLQEIINQAKLYPAMRKTKSREEILDYMRSKIKIELKQGSEQGLSSFSISYDDENRQLVAPVANQLAASFIEWNLKARQQQALITTQFLSSELDKAQKSLEEQEAALQSFRLQHSGATPDQLDGNLQALSRLQAEVQSHEDAISRLDEERILLSQQNPNETRTPSTLGERGQLMLEKSRLTNELLNLKRQFTDSYPDVVTDKAQLERVNARLAALPEPVVGSTEMYDSATQLRLGMLSKQIDRHRQQILVLQQQTAGYQSKVQSVPILETELAELTRNYETSRQSYQSLLDKTLSAGMSEDLERKQQAERFTVLDPASTPEKPYKPKRLPIIAGAIVLSVILSVGATVGINLLKGAVKSEADLNTMLPPKVRIIGTIPPIESYADTQRTKFKFLQTAVLSLIACGVLITFLLKVHTIL